MYCVINGKYIETEYQKIKYSSGDEKKVPVTVIYSGGEAVKVRGLETDSKLIGCEIDALCEVKLREFDGRKYLSINLMEGDA